MREMNEMSAKDSNRVCVPFRRLELALNRIIEIAIPFHLKKLEQHKHNIQMVFNLFNFCLNFNINYFLYVLYMKSIAKTKNGINCSKSRSKRHKLCNNWKQTLEKWRIWENKSWHRMNTYSMIGLHRLRAKFVRLFSSSLICIKTYPILCFIWMKIIVKVFQTIELKAVLKAMKWTLICKLGLKLLNKRIV